MTSFKQARVLEIASHRSGITEVKVDIDGEIFNALNYDDITGNIKEGDSIILNTIAVELGLGTGGKHFVLWNLRHKSTSSIGPGHILKLRHTPLQIRCLTVEEQESPFHERMKNSTDLKGMPVIVGSLHSQLPAVVATIKELNPKIRIAYVMTDGAALPIVFSNLVMQLKNLHLIDKTITFGHAFGGDFEAINVFSALIAAKEAAGADMCVTIMGPGIVGTDTVLGYSGIEQGVILNAVGALKGTPIAIVRLHFADKRKRHFGISHHTQTALSLVTLTGSVVVLPNMNEDKKEIVFKQLEESGISSKHKVVEVENEVTLKTLKKLNLDVTTMGRSVDEEPDFFSAAGAAGIYAVKQWERGMK
jgi:hypothetical protein